MEKPTGWIVLRSDTQRIVSENYTSQIFYALDLMKEMAEEMDLATRLTPSTLPDRFWKPLKKFKEWK